MHRRILALVLIAATDCGGPPLTVDADFETSTDFSKSKTWSWMAGAKPPEKDIDLLSRQRVQDAIEAELPRHGLAKKDGGGGRSVNCRISVEHKIKPSNRASAAAAPSTSASRRAPPAIATRAR